MHGDPLLHPSALDAASHRAVSAGHAGHPEPRRGAAASPTSTSSTPPPSATRRGRCTRSGPQWALVKGGHLRSSSHSPDLLFDGTDFHEFDAERIDTGHDHGAGDTLAAATASALAHGYSVPEAVAFGKRWVTECLRAAYPLGHGHGPVSALFRLHRMDSRRHRGRRPRTRRASPPASSLLTHGAGGNRESPMLIRLCDEWAGARLAGGALRPARTGGAARRGRRRVRRPPIRPASSRRSRWPAR